MANATQKIEGLDHKNELMETQISMLEGELSGTRAEIEMAHSFHISNAREENPCHDGGSGEDAGDFRKTRK